MIREVIYAVIAILGVVALIALVVVSVWLTLDFFI